MFVIPSTFWKIKKTPNRGRGVFAQKTIEPGTVIGDYIGVLKKENQVHETGKNFYAMSVGSMSIVPNKMKAGIHLINHSCSPNCTIHVYRGHILYVSIRRIFSGEELTVNYLCKIEDCESLCKHDVCQCGSPVCHGSFHVPARLFAQWERHEPNTYSYYKKFIPQTSGTTLQLLKKYPSSVPDSPAFELFGSWTKPTITQADRKLPTLTEIRNRIRNSGKRLYFKNMRLVVNGVSGNEISGQYK